MLEAMPAQLMDEWQAFFTLEPWGTEREDWRAGVVASTVANVSRSKKQKAYRPQDFMPKPRKWLSHDEIYRKLRMIG